MIQRWCLLTLAAVAPFLAAAGPSEEYAALRMKHKIAGASTVHDLRKVETVTILELPARVVGTIKGEGEAVTILFKFDDVSQTVDVAKPPSWLTMGVTDVRLIVKATKVDTQLVPALQLIASLPEADAVILEAKLKSDADRLAEEERQRAEENLLKRELESMSRSGFRDFRSTPPEGAGFTGTIGGSMKGGIIGGENNASVTQLLALVPDYAAYIMDRNKKLSPEQARLIAESVLAYSSTYGVDARLVISMIQYESNFNPRTTSHAGAQGLGQLMPDTSRSLGISDPFDIVQNVYGTVRTIRGHLERQGKEAKDTYDQLVRALAAYNAGPGAVKKYGGVPPFAETEAYIERVVKTYFKLSGQSQ
jgi:hypothetical protein